MIQSSRTDKGFRIVFLLVSFLTISTILYGQDGFSLKIDTLNAEEYGFFSIPEIDYEIEKINNYLNKTSKTIVKISNQLDTDTTYKSLLSKTKREADDFDLYEPEELSKFFLENSYRIWTGYMIRLKTIQSNSFNMLTSSEERNRSLEKLEKTWEKTYENTKNHRIPQIQIDKIRDIQKRINKQHDDNYKISLRIITYEAVITKRLNFVLQKLEQIEELQDIYRADLFTKTAVPIWGISLKDSTNRGLPESLRQAWYDNTKYLVSNYHAYYSHLKKFILFSLLLLVFHFLLRAKYNRKFGDIRKSKAGDLSFVIFQNPIASAISTVLFIFYVVFDNIPLALSGFVALSLLISVYFTLSNYLSKEGTIIIQKFILLLLLNTLEIIIWYIGDYSRLYLLFEVGISVWVTYYYITPVFTNEILPNLRFRRIISYVRYPIFALFSISFLGNIIGYVNLTIFIQKFAIHFTVIAILIIGIWHIVKSFLQLVSDLISRNEKIRLKLYMPILITRINQFFKLYFAYVLFNAFLNLFEIKSSFYLALNDFFTHTRNIGSLSFSFSDALLFIGILLLSWGMNSIVKMIFDEENYRKFESMRGIPSAISMTLRILFTSAGVFFAFSAAGFDMKSFSIILGALSVGIGFGLQNVVNNYISGLILIYERPVQKGDIVEVNNLLGEVVEIGIRRSNVRTFDGAEVIIPNANLTSNELINWTLSDKHKRLDIKVGVSYGSDPNLVLEILRDVAANSKLVVNIPTPLILFDEFGDSSLNFRVLCWVLLDNSLTAKSNIGVEIFDAFAERGIEIPFPQVDLHVKDTPAKAALQKKLDKKVEKPKEDNTNEGSYFDGSSDGD